MLCLFIEDGGVESRGKGRLFELAVELRQVVLDEALVGEAVVGVVADDHVVQDLDGEEPGRPDQLPGEALVLGGGGGVAGGVVVDEHHGRGPVLQGQGHHLAGVDGAAGEGSEEEVVVGDELVLAVEEQDLEHLALEVAHGVEQVVEDGAGGAEEGAVSGAVAEVAGGDLVDQVEVEGVALADAGDSGELVHGGGEDAREGLEAFQGLPGRELHVPAGRAHGEEELDDLLVGESLDPAFLELGAEPLAVALAPGLHLVWVCGHGALQGKVQSLLDRDFRGPYISWIVVSNPIRWRSVGGSGILTFCCENAPR